MQLVYTLKFTINYTSYPQNMHKAFVFGKFLPFHKGHEALINFASSKCDLLTVLICCSDKEPIPVSLRRDWLTNNYPDSPSIDFQILQYDEDTLPNTSAGSPEVSRLWANKFRELLPGYNTVITSETYGDLVAKYMGIEHILFDGERRLYPISGMQIRNDIAANWKYLPDSVKEYYITKVVILGTESTGKTTLTNRLASHFNGSSVMEAGRELITDSGSFSLDDLYAVAARHAADIAKASRGSSSLLIIDTDIHITLSYAKHFFGEYPAFHADLYRHNKANLYLYLNNDAAYEQDGTRLDEPERDRLDISHRKTLHDYHIPFEEISGSWAERFKKATALIDKLISTRSPIIRLNS
jgi:HTH-type transcriptional regulator, transcriptional repressor of NAD biosynthesis genes